tara:strand:- start:4665 stop:5333 length:669 start_codon:yes stop_codon:yes gene_type:complete
VPQIKYFLLLFGFFSIKFFAQGDANLLLQYNRGPTNESLYHPWNVMVQGTGVRMNTHLPYTRPRLSWGLGVLVQHKFSKTVGLATGATYLNIHYRYQKQNLDSKDFLGYWRIPLALRVSPNRRIVLELGPSFHLIQKAKNSDLQDPITESFSYPPGLFQNAFGLLTTVSYRFWRSFSGRLEYNLIKKTDNPFVDQSNTFRGVNLGLEWSLFNPTKPNKNAVR